MAEAGVEVLQPEEAAVPRSGLNHSEPESPQQVEVSLAVAEGCKECQEWLACRTSRKVTKPLKQ